MKSLTLFCLPHAGGSELAYRDWQAQLPGWISLVPMRLPGRGARRHLPALPQWPELLDRLADDVRPYLDLPFALFGHSMGALIGFELIRTLRGRFGVSPLWFGASACVAPTRREFEPKWLTCCEDEVLERLRSLNGTHDELLRDRDFVAMLLPTLRADFHLCGSYRYTADAPLVCDLTVLGGLDDDMPDGDEDLKAWSRETTGRFRLRMFEGGHFFIDRQREAVLSAVVADLTSARALTGIASVA